ncbi:hypothetical protein D3C86_1273300 [compost metagenome]
MVGGAHAVDEEGRGAADAGRHGGFDIMSQGLARGRIGQAGLHLRLGATADADGAHVPVARVTIGEGGRLTGHEGVGDIEKLARSGAAADGCGRGRYLGRLGRQVAEHQPDLARVDIAGLERRQDVVGPVGAVSAGEGSVLDHRDGGVGPTQDAVGGGHRRYGGHGGDRRRRWRVGGDGRGRDGHHRRRQDDGGQGSDHVRSRPHRPTSWPIRRRWLPTGRSGCCRRPWCR